jgi:hypothetical protein
MIYRCLHYKPIDSWKKIPACHAVITSVSIPLLPLDLSAYGKSPPPPDGGMITIIRIARE